MFNKLELDVMQANELIEAANLAAKYKFPAIVVHPAITSEAMMARGRAGGQYKIITPVDCPKGEVFGMTKFRGLSTDALDADGFEIMLTAGKTVTDTRNEAKSLTDFIKQHLTELTEVRFVFGVFSRTEEDIATLCEALLDVRMPAMIRTDHQLKLQISKANADTHNQVIDKILEKVKVPIKLSANINSVRTITSCDRASRFAVNVLQAKAIIKEFQNQPQELRGMLESGSPQ